MIDMETLTDIDAVISKITNSNIEAKLQSTFLDQPTLIQAKSEPKMNIQMKTNENNIIDTATVRSYEMNSGVLNESYSILEDTDNSAEILADTDMNPNNDLIIIISDDIRSDELTNIYNKFKDRLKLIIHYGNNVNITNIINNFSEVINVNSLKKAVNKSYINVKNGQTILFPRIETNFDYFKHVKFS
ncbi:MAG: hypothetical protein DRI95_09590 [Bacteroidetes bacterium]|nr:MAG: hypothetical protein DRI95_09590 [Bacteroidota bacterium]